MTKNEATVINFVCSWPTDRTQAWSGSLFFLFEALKKDGRVVVNDIDISPKSYLEKLIVRLKRRGTIKLFIPLFNFYVRRKVKKKAIGNIIFSIEEIDLGNDYIYYLYQDLCYRYHHFIETKKPYGWEYSAQGYSEKEYQFLIKYADSVYNKCSSVFCMSNNLYRYFLSLNKTFSKKAVFCGAGVNSVSFEKNVDSKDKTILFIGKDFLRKGGDIVCSAFNSLDKTEKDGFRLIVVGPQSIDGIYLGEDICFMGELSYSECADLLAKASIFCMPSRFEAYGLVFAEALCSGCFCIANNEYEMKYFINRDNGILVNLCENEQSNIANMRSALVEAMQRKKGIDVDIYRAKYSWNAVSNTIIETVLAHDEN